MDYFTILTILITAITVGLIVVAVRALGNLEGSGGPFPTIEIGGCALIVIDPRPIQEKDVDWKAELLKEMRCQGWEKCQLIEAFSALNPRQGIKKAEGNPTMTRLILWVDLEHKVASLILSDPTGEITFNSESVGLNSKIDFRRWIRKIGWPSGLQGQARLAQYQAANKSSFDRLWETRLDKADNST